MGNCKKKVNGGVIGMGRRDTEYQQRMAGMIYAANYAKEKGLEELQKEIKRRGFTKIPLGVRSDDMDRLISEMSQNVYTMTLMTMLYSCKEVFGFGKERLHRLKNKFDEIIASTMDLDYMSQHYISMGDYARELSERYDIEIDLQKVDYLQQSYDTGESSYRTCKIDRVLEELKANGFEAAAGFLEDKLV